VTIAVSTEKTPMVFWLYAHIILLNCFFSLYSLSLANTGVVILQKATIAIFSPWYKRHAVANTSKNNTCTTTNV